MSYEGYEVWLCANGHRATFDCYVAPDEKEWRCHCGAARAWWCAVDQTNGEGEEPNLIVAQEATVNTCACCGHRTWATMETYVIPETKP